MRRECLEYREKIDNIQKLLEKQEDTSAEFEDLQQFLNKEIRRSNEDNARGEGHTNGIADHSEL